MLQCLTSMYSAQKIVHGASWRYSKKAILWRFREERELLKEKVKQGYHHFNYCRTGLENLSSPYVWLWLCNCWEEGEAGEYIATMPAAEESVITCATMIWAWEAQGYSMCAGLISCLGQIWPSYRLTKLWIERILEKSFRPTRHLITELRSLFLFQKHDWAYH